MGNNVAERNVTMMVKCHMCNKQYNIMVTEDSAIEWMSPNRRLVQEVFPYLTPDERELITSHTCPVCWDNLFGTDEEDEDLEGKHYCKYCGNIAEGENEDVLCEDCKQLFGHSLYSEL